MSMHREDYQKAGDEAVAVGGGIVAWFRAHPSVSLVLAGAAAAIVLMLIFMR